MKYIIAAFLVATLLSCNKTEKTIIKSDNDKTELKTHEFMVDSINIHDSIALNKLITADFNTTVLVFPTLENKKLLDSIYSPLNLNLINYSKPQLQFALNKSMKSYFAENKESLKNYPGEFKQTWSQNSDMKLFQKNERFMTILYNGDGFSGGAHGYYYEFYKNFDLQSNTTLQLRDVVTTTNSKIWDPIMMKAFLKNKNYSIDLLFDKRIPLNENFYLQNNNLHFVYGQYEIAPYVVGIINISIPISEISQYLTPKFKADHFIK